MCPSNIHVFTYKTVYTGICTPKWTKMPEFYASHFCGALDIFLWRTTFCGAPCSGAPQNYCGWGPAELFLWRTGLGAPQKYHYIGCATEKKLWRRFCGAPSKPGGAPQKLKLEASFPMKLNDSWEPVIKMKLSEFEGNDLCDIGSCISVMPKIVYDILKLAQMFTLLILQ